MKLLLAMLNYIAIGKINRTAAQNCNQCTLMQILHTRPALIMLLIPLFNTMLM